MKAKKIKNKSTKIREAIINQFDFVVEVNLQCPYCKEPDLLIVEVPYHEKIHKCNFCGKEFKTSKFDV